jgi:hypothetical protein
MSEPKPSHLSSYSVSRYSITRYSITRVPPGLTADAIAVALRPYGTDVDVRLVPANPIFRYGGVQHAAIITMHAVANDLKVVYDLEAQLHFTIQKMNGPNEDFENEKEKEKQRLWRWRWALRGIVIQ